MGEADQRQPNGGLFGETDQLALGREAYDRSAWEDAYRRLSVADEASPLGVEDLERLAMAAYLADGTTATCALWSALITPILMPEIHSRRASRLLAGAAHGLPR